MEFNPIVQHRHLLVAAMPKAHHVGLGGAADGHEVLRALREERQDMRQIEHSEARILAGNVEVREIVYGRRRGQRVPRAHASVRRADDESVEFLLVPCYPERQHEEVPKHAENGTASPARGGDSW